MKLFQSIKPGLLASAALLLASCQSSIRSDVVTFHEETPMPAGETIKVVPMDPGNYDSLEFRNYARRIGDELRKIGYTPVEDPNAETELLAEVDYSVEVGPSEVYADRTPMPFARYHFGFGRYYDPFYWGVYDTYTPEVYSVPTYMRNLEMNIVDESEGERIFEGRVQSNGTGNQLPEVMPYLITAMFENFPGESGVTKVVTIETDM